ncbi:MAG: glycosyltransferase family 2 protein [Lachnospiraceae bacterium]|nr:glycosyltransferase family 2 protein [Lachnospiraceae bacterium]
MNNLHTFVICAYKESPYIEECIRSLKNQTVTSRILLATSTPSEYLEHVCKQYDIPYHVREGQSNISLDWNYALSVADTEYVTIAHQDDVYGKEYAEEMMRMVEKKKEQKKQPLILFSDYVEQIGNQTYADRTNLRIKKILLYPLGKSGRQNKTFWKRWVLRFGNAICCPAVTYHVPVIREYMSRDHRQQLFQKHFRSNVDWETWEWLSKKDGSFCYIQKPLMAHRIHADSETTATIEDHQRSGEDYEMFRRFWPGWIAGLLTGAYKESEKGNAVN